MLKTLDSSHVRSLAIALSGAIGAALTSWASSTDLGVWGPFVGAAIAWAVNAGKVYWESLPPAAASTTDHSIDTAEFLHVVTGPRLTSTPPTLPLVEPDCDPPGYRADDGPVRALEFPHAAPKSMFAPPRPAGQGNGYPTFPRPIDTAGPEPTKLGVMLLAVFLGLGCVTHAEQPRAIITGPQTGTAGELLTLDASGSEGEPKHFKWSISPELRGRKQLVPADSGKRCTVASYPGSYVVTLAVANDSGIDSLTWQITIPGEAPCPPPEPKPVVPTPITPTPRPVDPVVPLPVDPTPPAGEFGLAPDVYRAAMASTSATRAADCLKLAADCRRIAAAEWSSTNAIAAEMVRVLVALPAGWEPLKSKVKTTVATLAGEGRITSAADVKRLLLELAVAFERAGK